MAANRLTYGILLQREQQSLLDLQNDKMLLGDLEEFQEVNDLLDKLIEEKKKLIYTIDRRIS